MKYILYRFFSFLICAAMTFACITGMSFAADTSVQKQWNLSGDGYGIGVDAAKANGLTGSGVKIAIIDSGINRVHEDLQGVAIETGCNIINNTTDITDNFGHGTFIAGIIAANAHNGVGISGICDQVTLVPIKCFDSSLTNVKHVVAGIYKAVDEYQCDVINLSLGVTTDMPALREAIDYAASRNVIIVAAVGNNGEMNPEQILYPAAYENVIGVGAHDQNGNICTFSHINTSVFVTAPGDNIYSLDAKNSIGYNAGSGTSFASAHVAAMAVIAKSYDKNITVEEFKALLANSAVDAGVPGYDTTYGYGMVSIPGMIQELQKLPVFRDIGQHWAKENIEFCYELGLLSGVGEGLFQPDGTLTRAMVVSALWRLEGCPADNGTVFFADIQSGTWYDTAVKWAAEHHIVNGYGEGRFGPDDNVTREQLATILYGYAAYKNMNLTADSPTSYIDWTQISSYAVQPVSWAITNHIISGKTQDTIVPQGAATRAEVATILRNFLSIL